MNEPHTADRTTTPAPVPVAGEGAGRPARRLGIAVHPDSPKYAQEATAAYIAEYDDLLAHAAAHPGEDWVAYRGAQRIGIGTDHRELLRQCDALFPDGEFVILFIDPILQYPDDLVV